MLKGNGFFNKMGKYYRPYELALFLESNIMVQLQKNIIEWLNSSHNYIVFKGRKNEKRNNTKKLTRRN